MDDIFFFQTTYPELKTTHRLNHSVSGINFHFWKRRLTLLLEATSLGYVLTEPKPNKDNNPDHNKWVDDDFKVRHIILGTLDDNLFLTYHQHETAKSMLDALTMFFARPSMGKKIMLLRRYMNHTMKEETTSIDKHIIEMMGMVRDLKFQGMEIPDDVQAMVLLDSLPDSWADVVTSIRINLTLDEEAFGFNDVRKRLKNAGTWKQFRKDRDDGETSSMVSSRGGFRGNCYNCGQFGHRQSDCPN